ncbi:MAG: efflux RND transporter permease subunit [Planctomycetota bacterium]|nr:efflux RND transporter permease subunit [Planctomycetota bacterium]
MNRPVTMFMLFLTLIGTGVISYRKTPLMLLPPGLSASNLSVELPFPGAGPQEVEDQLTRPVEEQLRTIPGIKEIFSVSRENFSSIEVVFNNTTDMDIAYGEVRDRIERIRTQLPPEMDRYRIFRRRMSDIPIMWIGIQYDEDSADPFGPIERIAVRRLEGVDGVARVGLYGVVDEAVRIFVDVEKVKGYGVDLRAVIQRMRNDNFTLPAGMVDDSNRTLALRIDSRYQNLDQVRAYPVGNDLVLGDIAEVVQARGYRDWVWRINSRGAVGLDISRESDENTIAVCSRIEETIANLEQDPRLQGVTFNVFFSQKEVILDAIGGLQQSALWGGLFAVIVLFFFLRDLRMTLLAALAIPSSLLAALIATYFGGQTLNLISLAGFTLGIGMLVDNAVVVIENISRKRSEGLDRKSASSVGASQVSLAVVTATATSIVVFLPLVFMDGDRNNQVMMQEVGLPISYSLASSLLVALIFLPAFCARIMSRNRSKSADLHFSGKLVTGYERTLGWVLQHRLGSLLLLLLVVSVAMQASSKLRSANTGNEGDDSIRMSLETPSTYSLGETNAVFAHFERWADKNQEAFGYDFYSTRFSRRGGRLDFYPRRDLEEEAKANMPYLLRTKAPTLPGVEVTVGRDGETGSKELRVNLKGRDFTILAGIADDLKERLEALTLDVEGVATPMFENVRTDIDDGLDEIHIKIDRDRASDLGVLPETVQGMVAWGLGGQRLPDFQDGERDIRMQIEYGQSDQESLEFIRNMGLSTLSGDQVPLVSVADLSFDKSVGALVRRNGETSTRVTALPTVDDLYLVSRGLKSVLDNYPFPEGYNWTEEGGQQDFEQDMIELMKTLLFSVLLVYLLMAILLESVTLPFSILVSIPLALMGVNITLYLTNRATDAMVIVGMILLAGIVVNNAIVLLDRVQRLRAEGRPRNEALVRGGAERLRPIIMTALTTIFGLMPMAMPQLFPGDAESSGYESMAITVAGGLAFSTFFTLLAVPLFYSFFDDLSGACGALLPWNKRPREMAGNASGEATGQAAPLAAKQDN